MDLKPVVSFLLVLLAAVLVACGGAGQTGVEPTTIEVVTHDIYYGDTPDNATNPPVWTAVAGSVATISFDNQGALDHNWAVIKPGAEVPVPFNIDRDGDLVLYQTGLVPPGEQRSFAFEVPAEPGEYLVICTVSGHYPGMQGRLVVS